MNNIYLNSAMHNVIVKDMAANMLNHAYMLIGNDKVLINGLADYLSCTLLCDSIDDDFKCNICIKVLNGSHSDVMNFGESKSVLTEDINKIIDDCYVLPMEGEKKIYLLKNFDLATPQAQNKLLKTLEEPPKSVIFIITTTNENNVLATIRSRCKKVVIGKLDDDLVIEYIKNQSNLSESEVRKICTICDGNLTLIQSFLKDSVYLDMKNLSEDIFRNLKDSGMVLFYSSKMQKYKSNVEVLLNQMLLSVRDIFVAKNEGNENYPIDKYNEKSLSNIAQAIQKAIKKVKSNCNINSVCDGVLMEILEVKFKCQK